MKRLLKIPTLRFLFICSVLSGTTGCFWVAVGGAGAGGYYVGQDERSVGQITRDAAITTEVNAKLVRDREIKTMQIDVDTYNGVVRLTGRVPSSAARERVIGYARSIRGVQEVLADLRIGGN